MEQEIIDKVKLVLNDWNPLGKNASKIEDLKEYEIDSALDKVDYKGRRHIDEMDPTKIAGFFSDDGYEINPDQIKMPSLCLICIKNYEPGLEDDILCNLNRYDQRDSDNFICHAFEKM